MNFHWLKKSLGFLIAFAILFFLGQMLVVKWREIKDYSWHFHLLWLIASFTTFLLYSCLSVKPWLAYLKQRGEGLPYRKGFQIFSLSQLGKYLPGKMWHLFGQMYLCEKAGIRKTDALLSIGFHLGFLTLSGIFISLCGLLFLPGQNFPLTGPVPRLIPFFLIMVVVGIFTLARCGEKMFHFISRKVFRTDILFKFSFFQFLRFLLTYLLLWGCCGLAFFLFVKSLSPLGWHQFPAMMGIYATAWTVGFLSVVTPGGLGIREGVLSLLLSAYLPPATATLVALLSRLWSLAAELVLAGGAITLRWKRRQGNLEV